MDFIFDHYEEIKAVHVISVISWYAGLFYLFRLYVYHVQNKNRREVCEVFEVMEKRLLRVIMAPACLLTLISGSMIASVRPDLFVTAWPAIKLSAVIGLLAYQELGRRTRLRFLRRDFFLSEKQCRAINEIPTVLLVVIVSMVILKPW